MGFKTLTDMDDDEHRGHRGLTADWFKPANLCARVANDIARLAGGYIDKMASLDGGCDFATEIANLYPLRVITSIVGVPQEDEPKFLRWAQEFMGQQDSEFTSSPDVAIEQRDREAVTAEFFGYFDEIAETRRKNPTGDVASAISNGTVDGRALGRTETLSYLFSIIAAGHHTTAAALSGGLEILATHPGVLHDLRHNEDLIPNAVEEILRWTTPGKGFTRTAVTDYELAGVSIAAGDRLLMSYPSANRDADVFAQPFTFDIRRPNANRHLTFGYGRHFCLGAHLARMELREFFRRLIPRLEEVRLAGEPQRTKDTLVSGVKHLPVSYTLSR